MTVTRKRRGRHHHGDLRRALLDAVAELVLEQGPEAVTLRECARRAGVSHSAATPHFGDKRGLLTAFATEGGARLAAAQRAALSALPPPAATTAAGLAQEAGTRLAQEAGTRLAATGRAYIAFARANPAHFRLMFRTDLLDRADPDLQAAMQAAFAPLEEIMPTVAPGADADGLRARLSLAWCGVHGFCALRAEGAGGDLWSPAPREAATVEAMISLIVAACRG